MASHVRARGIRRLCTAARDVFAVEEREAFARDGFVLRHGVLERRECEVLRDHFTALFAGKFPTKVYPDEWHWRQGISKDDAFREIVNGWKCSPLVAAVSLSPRLGKLASSLLGWRAHGGARLAQDDLLWKPPGAAGVGFHIDGTYISDQFVPAGDPALSVTVWIALDDADAETGAVQYAVGSHTWACRDFGGAFFGSDGDDVEAPARRAAEALGCKLVVRTLEVPTGSAVFHHQNVLHGSARNRSTSRPRRALGVHLLRRDAEFRAHPQPDYIYGRYVLDGERQPREEFFPVTWSPEGYRSPVCYRLLS